MLLGSGERDERPFHPLVTHAVVPPLSAAALDQLPLDGSCEETVLGLQTLCRSGLAELTADGLHLVADPAAPSASVA